MIILHKIERQTTSPTKKLIHIQCCNTSNQEHHNTKARTLESTPDIPGNLREGTINHGQDAAQAGDDLQAVVDANQAIVAGLGGEVVLVHHVVSVGRHSRKVADAALHAGAELGAVLLSTGSGAQAAEVELALCNVKNVSSPAAKSVQDTEIAKDEIGKLTEARVLAPVTEKDLLTQLAL